MKPQSLAGLIGLACLGAEAQVPFPNNTPQSLETVVVTATRSLQQSTPTLRDAIVITREDLEDAGSLSLAEVLQRRAGVEFRATGGPGQPTGLFLRGAGTAQTLVLVDGLRVGSATVGTTSIENIPLELIERIEVVKGPLSSLYGSDAIGGVIQVFTRGKKVPYFFASGALGTDSDRRVSAGVTGVDKDTSFSLTAGTRKVDAQSATNPKAFCHDPDRDPHENSFAQGRIEHRLWQGETLALEAFVAHGKTRFDGCPNASGQPFKDENDQTITGFGASSSSQFLPWWSSRLAYGHGRDELKVDSGFPGRFETRQDQLSWVHEFVVRTGGTALLGFETLLQKVLSDDNTPFAKDQRDIHSVFVAANESIDGQRIEASARYDRDDQFGGRTTGSASYGVALGALGTLSATYGRGFRTPTFYDLYGPTSDFYQPNPALAPERSKSWEIALMGGGSGAPSWRLTAFDNRIEDLITYVFPTVENVKRARIRGLEGTLEATWLGARWRANATAQRPRDEDTGKRLQGRAELFGTLDASRAFGAWTAGMTLVASGDRFDSTTESSASRLGGYAVLDARLRYAFTKRWSAELTAANLLDRKYESASGYDAPRRSVLLTVRLDAF